MDRAWSGSCVMLVAVDGPRALLDLLPALHDASDQHVLFRLLTRGIPDVVPCDLVTLNLISTRPGAPTTVPYVWPEIEVTDAVRAAFDRVANDHPLLLDMHATGDWRPRRMSDFVPTDVFRTHPLYLEVFAPLGMLHQVGFSAMATPETVVGIGVNRAEDDFDDDELEAVTLLWRQLPAVLDHVHLRALHREAVASVTDEALTDRERQIMLHVRAGLSNKEISEHMLLGRRTVEKHLERIYDRLGVRSRAGAVRALWPTEAGPSEAGAPA